MNWTEFLLAIAGTYLIYYALNLLYDLFFTAALTEENQDDDVLHFQQEGKPELIIPEEQQQPLPSPPPFIPAAKPKPKQGFSSGNIFSTGAVSMQELIEQARLGTIEFTKGIAY